MPASAWTLDPHLLGVNLVWLESVGIPAPASHITSLDFILRVSTMDLFLFAWFPSTVPI